ncbi:MAG: hypothetical protein AB1Z67_05250 [Candidatus Limnocylindrales bacterium]
MHILLRTSLALLALLAIGGCSALPFITLGPGDTVPTEVDDRFPDVIGVQVVPTGERIYDVVVSISSPYDSPERYADGWRVLDEAGNVLGTHTLLHHHANEQPFTRTQRGLEVPADVSRITVEGRDLVNGYGGGTLWVDLPE